jgi:hypothetical protein
MMRKLALLPALLVGACQTQADNSAQLPPSEQPAAQAPRANAPPAAPDQLVSSSDQTRPAPAQGGCAALQASDWAAWVSAMPGPGARPRLIATGKVTVPTGGYRYQWAGMEVAESYPVQVYANLQLVPPSGGATQAVTTLDIRGEWPIDPPVGSFTVRCGGKVLARISPVETAH